MIPIDIRIAPARTESRGPAGALLAAALLAAALSGCMSHQSPDLAVAAPTAAESAPAASQGRPAVKTVRRSPASGADEVADASSSGIPAPRQIFDFHPAGGKADDWRQPFVIDPNDGPLAADVRRSTAELRSYLADTDHATKPAVAHRCGESEVANAKAGCAGPVTTGSIVKPPSGSTSPTP